MPKSPPLKTADYARLAAFRYALRSFVHFSEAAAARVGLTGQQYQAMLCVRSRADSAPVSISDLATELLIRHNSAVGLVDRLVTQGFMERIRKPEDRRRVELRMTPHGDRLLRRLARVHRAKLERIGPDIHRILAELSGAWRER